MGFLIGKGRRLPQPLFRAKPGFRQFNIMSSQQNPANTAPIFLISGVPGAGKTSVAKALMKRFPFGMHIPVDDLRGWVVSGIAHPIPKWSDETSRQFRLGRRATTEVAKLYAQEGFAVAIDDVILPAEAPTAYEQHLRDGCLHKVILLPDVQIALERNRMRTNKIFDTQVLEETIQGLWMEFSQQAAHYREWISIDSSKLDIKETVQSILEQTEEIIKRDNYAHSRG